MSHYTPLGWPVLDTDQVHNWTVPGVNRTYQLHPIYGFILVVWSVWYNRVIEPLSKGGKDEGGYARRPNRNNASVFSEHAGGVALDENSAEHPNGVAPIKTFTPGQLWRMRKKRDYWNRLVGTNVIRLGIDYQSTPDGMHKELFHKPVALKRLMRIIAKTTDGQKVIKANPQHCASLKKRGYL